MKIWIPANKIMLKLNNKIYLNWIYNNLEKKTFYFKNKIKILRKFFFNFLFLFNLILYKKLRYFWIQVLN